ncbi:MAG TPA: M15 family metallopeptidase [Spirochaetia bacterium]|nr:M15 family metallopeptidase [Spirochaetia bacterium]
MDGRTYRRAPSRRAGRVSLGLSLGLTLVVALGIAGCRAEEGSIPGTDGAAQSDNGAGAAEEERAVGGETAADAAIALVSGAPPEVRAAVALDPEPFVGLLDEVLELPADRTVLVDKAHALAPDSVPADLVELDSLSDRLVLSRPGHRLTSDATEALLEMSADAATEGITLVVSSAYRSYDYQAGVYARWVEQLGQEQADRVSARPGTSQHQLGTAVDFGCICDEFASQPAGLWLAANARRFGFSLSYPDGYEGTTGYAYEPWHFRFVGRSATELEHRYFAGVQQWMLEFLDREFFRPRRDGELDG